MATFLIIDDCEDIGTIIRKYLEDEGHVVRVALDGETGIEMFKTHPCDIVICDILLPEISGIEALKTMKELRPNSTLSAITGSPELIQEIISDREPLLCDLYFMGKPFSIDDLELFGRRLLKGLASKG